MKYGQWGWLLSFWKENFVKGLIEITENVPDDLSLSSEVVINKSHMVRVLSNHFGIEIISVNINVNSLSERIKIYNRQFLLLLWKETERKILGEDDYAIISNILHVKDMEI